VDLTDDPVEAVLGHLRNPDAVIERIERGQAAVAELAAPEVIARRWLEAASPPHAAPGGEPDERGPPPPRASLTSATGRAREPVRLNLGCGDKILPDFVNVDVVEARAGKRPDVICDLHQLTPFPDDYADEILAVHVVEHFWRWEVEDVLREWVRVLRPGGRMVLECPNLKSACEAFLANPDSAFGRGNAGQRTMWVFYGDPGWKDPLMVHRWGYTPTSLAALMESVGLRNARQEPAQFKLREPRDMRIVAEKPN
jgi:SAM-dependent methyltransferase